jgi:DNA-binding XRE family transcriptional regulator
MASHGLYNKSLRVAKNPLSRQILHLQDNAKCASMLCQQGTYSTMSMSPRLTLLTPAQVLAWRQKLNIHQTEAADLLGVSRRNYINLERGDSPVYKALVLSMWLINEIAAENTTYSELKTLLTHFIVTMQEEGNDGDNKG